LLLPGMFTAHGFDQHLQIVAGVIIQKADHVGVLASPTEGEDVGLPHLIGSGTLEG
jgi:hypothetical protein